MHTNTYIHTYTHKFIHACMHVDVRNTYTHASMVDQDGSGVVQQDEILEQMKKMGKNWDHEGIAYFLSQIDVDGSGEIDKHEFIEYILKVEAEVKSG